MNRLRELRKARGLTREAVARSLGLSANSIGGYELENRDMSIKTLVDLSEFYNVSIDYILCNDEKVLKYYGLDLSGLDDRDFIVISMFIERYKETKKNMDNEKKSKK